jgi:ubiquinone/menaquinone biosynthesis C-methylase UbiE
MDQTKLAATSLRVIEDWGGAHRIALAYIADRLGIFRALASAGPATSAELAARTRLNERYLREWAAAMATAGYVDYDSDTRTFSLSPEQAAVLADEGGPAFLGGGFQYAQACVRKVPELMDAFRHGGGVPFADFGPEIAEAIARLFAPGYEAAVAAEWIPALGEIHERVQRGAQVAEVGCGTGQALIPVARAYPNSRFTGFDVDPGSVAKARTRAAESGLADRLAFELAAAEHIPGTDHFDLIMAFNCIHDMADPRGALSAIRRALRPDGVFLWAEANASDKIEENTNPLGRLLYATSCMHCMTVSLAQGGEGLGNVVGISTARELANEAGFAQFERLPVTHTYFQLFALRR